MGDPLEKPASTEATVTGTGAGPDAEGSAPAQKTPGRLELAAQDIGMVAWATAPMTLCLFGALWPPLLLVWCVALVLLPLVTGMVVNFRDPIWRMTLGRTRLTLPELLLILFLASSTTGLASRLSPGSTAAVAVPFLAQVLFCLPAVAREIFLFAQERLEDPRLRAWRIVVVYYFVPSLAMVAAGAFMVGGLVIDCFVDILTSSAGWIPYLLAAALGGVDVYVYRRLRRMAKA
ncbi:MAG: hypothetical protein HYZ53_19590 [Planctomycetes bacterium]|nr:hypothetical protein [Planctomycetota bacterium]